MRKSALLAALKQEIQKHDLSTFMQDKVCVTGCPLCKKRFQTVPQFIEHITEDVLPPLLDRVSSQ